MFRHNLLDEILQGKKSSTLRTKCKHKKGEVVILRDQRRKVNARIITIRRIKLQSITKAILQSENIKSKEKLISLLKKFYGSLPPYLVYIQFEICS